jgi:hypothetical protein
MVVACVGLTLSASACPQTEDSKSTFSVADSHPLGWGYVPTGQGWTPGSKVSIWVWDEPNGPSGSRTGAWKDVFDTVVDQNGMFGETNPILYAVRPSLCGTTEQKVTFRARSLTTGRAITAEVSARKYFTGDPCLDPKAQWPK